MTRLLMKFFCVILSGAIITAYKVGLTLYAGGNCGGHTNTNSLENGACFNWPNFGYEMSGAKMTRGSCARFHYYLNCNDVTFYMFYPTTNFCILPCCNDHILSVSGCTTRNVNINCPDGSYVRQVTHGAGNEDVTIRCYRPTESIPIYTGNTGSDTPSSPITSSCDIAAHGLTTSITSQSEIHLSPTLDCHRKFSLPTNNITSSERQDILTVSKFGSKDQNDDNATLSLDDVGVETYGMCSSGEALTGISATVDEAGTIKQVSLRCKRVPDPSSVCEPKEMLAVVLNCDNSGSSVPFECSYIRKIGVGEAETLTNAERLLLEFSVEFGYTIRETIPALSESMSEKLGSSDLVSYNWSMGDSTTWKPETMNPTTIQVGPRIHLKVEQLIGRCSFYNVGVNYFRQSDVNVVTGETTITEFAV